jgi:thymidylate synthase
LAKLSALHYKKSLVYKDSWKKHGEVLGVFANITRKYDRIEAIIAGGVKTTSDQSLLDTVGELAVYYSKYLTYLAERGYLPIFHSAIPCP